MQIEQMPQPTFFMFKCEQSAPAGVEKPACVDEETKDLFDYLSLSMMRNQIMGPVRVVKTSCLGRCSQGPLMLVEPGHHMYCKLSKEKIDKIVTEHILGGKPVLEYLIPEQFWGEPINLAQ